MPRCLFVLFVSLLCLLPAGHAAHWLRTGPDGGRVSCLASAPSSPGIIYAGGAGVYRSPDNGATWLQMADPFPSRSTGSAEPVTTQLAVHPNQPNRVFAGTPQGLFLTRNGGRTWQRAGGITETVTAVTFGAGGSTVYASTSAHFYRSGDAGETWTSVALPGEVASLCGDPRSADTVLAALKTPSGAGRTLFQSVDRGAHWSAFSLLETPLSSVCAASDGAVFFAGSPGETGGVYRVERDGNATVVSSIPSIGLCAASQLPGFVLNLADPTVETCPVYRTVDGGSTWTGIRTGFGSRGPLSLVIGSDLTPVLGTQRGGVLQADVEDRWIVSGTGLGMADISGVWQRPDRPGCLYASLGDGLYRSLDAGRHWTRVSIATSQSVMACSPARAGRVFFTSANGLSISDNGGDSWKLATSGLPASADTRTVLCDPARSDVVFAALADGSVFRSNTSVVSFKKVLTAQTGGPTILAVAPSDTGTLYACRPTVGYYRSTDSGTTWEVRGTEVPAPGTLLAVHPQDPSVVLRVRTVGTGYSIDRSADGAISWTAVHTESGVLSSAFRVLFIAADARRPGRFLLGTSHGLRVSENGTVWREETVFPSGAACASWTPFGASGDMVGTLGAGTLIGFPAPQGDPDHNGRIQATDALAILGMSLSDTAPTSAQQETMDANGDGILTPGDADLCLGAATGP